MIQIKVVDPIKLYVSVMRCLYKMYKVQIGHHVKYIFSIQNKIHQTILL